MKAIPYGRQHITEEDIKGVIETLKSDFLTQGPKIAEFERNFAEYIGSQYAVAVSNGTAALHLCALTLNVNEKTNVITTPITFAASANCIRYCGGNVFFADINPETFLLDINKVEALIESKPKGFFQGIIPVDFAGQAVDLEAFRELANKHKLWIIEDACHAPGGYFKDSKGISHNCGDGAFADMAIFSFHPVKHIATGEGGMITTNNKALYDKLCLLRTHGITKNPAVMTEDHGGWYYQMMELGYNYRMPDMLCALGITQLKKASEGLQRRREIAEKYNRKLLPVKDLKLQDKKFHEGHAFHLYIIRTQKRLELYNYLRDHSIFAQVHYIPVHTMPYYKSLGFKKGDFPLAESYYDQCLSIPVYPSLSDEEQNYVIETIRTFFTKN